MAIIYLRSCLRAPWSSYGTTSFIRSNVRPVPKAALRDEFVRLDGPLEPPMPRFERGPAPATKTKPSSNGTSGKDRWRPQRRRRSYKATLEQAILGAIIGGCCSFASFKALVASYDHVSQNPLAHDVPFGLTEGVNEAVLTMILGFGWLWVSLFAVSSTGLALLAGKLMTTKTTRKSMKKWSLGIASTILLYSSTSTIGTSEAEVQPNPRAAELFDRSCMGCHARGGNILKPGASLRADDLTRNGLSTVEEIFKITYFGKDRMPGFGEDCAPKGQCTFGPRISEQEIRALAEFVKSQAEQGWLAK